ncbi:hypothetical protein [Novosphingobium malaysiense]|uniref:hypothetical protein n=1 Tax=Novosphingobium malaysiense TaxID=1348853 RepID=UPI0012E08877|nr:hypothetical protein [Novosphingobium malaysiense]
MTFVDICCQSLLYSCKYTACGTRFRALCGVAPVCAESLGGSTSQPIVQTIMGKPICLGSDDCFAAHNDFYGKELRDF